MAFTNLVRKINEKSVIACMRDGKTHTKQEIAGLTGLSFPTVGKLVEELAGGGMLLRLGTKKDSPGGRKAEIYRLNPDFAHILLMFLQGDAVFYRVCDAMGTTISEGRKRREEPGCLRQDPENGIPSQFLPGTGGLLQICAAEMIAADEAIGAVSVGIPGSVHNGTVFCIDGYPGLEGQNIAKALSEAVGKPVAAGNNMSLVAVGMAGKTGQGDRSLHDGESDGRTGARNKAPGGGNPETCVCLHLADTGPGMGAVVNGRALQGFSGFQGEVGFMPLYGDENVQKLALDGFRRVPPGECLGKIAACICTVLNPGQFVCYLEQERPGLKEEIVRYCGQYLPAYAMPRFVFDRDYREDYFHGLAVTGMELVYG